MKTDGAHMTRTRVRTRVMMRWLLSGVAGLSVVTLTVDHVRAVESQASTTVSAQTELVQTYCIRCHNDRAMTGGLSLSNADLGNVGTHVEEWEKAVRKLRARAMPPAGMPRPDEAAFEGPAFLSGN